MGCHYALRQGDVLMARKNNFISSLVFLVEVLSNLFKEIKALGGNEESFYSLKNAKKIKEIAKIIVGNIKGILFPGNEYLKLISLTEDIVIDPCDGSELLSDATDTFVYIDSDFKNYDANEKGGATETIKVGVYELIKNSRFADFFNSVSVSLDKLCFTQNQIKRFVKKHRNWLRTNGYATFFLFKSGGKFFVAGVYFNADVRLRVHVFRLEDDHVWHAECRHCVVLPQLDAL